jgi:hypothetical protein
MYVSRTPARWNRGGICTARQHRVELVAVDIEARQSVGEIRVLYALNLQRMEVVPIRARFSLGISPSPGFRRFGNRPERVQLRCLTESYIVTYRLSGRFRRSSLDARSDHVLACAGRQQHEASLATSPYFSNSLLR